MAKSDIVSKNRWLSRAAAGALLIATSTVPAPLFAQDQPVAITIAAQPLRDALMQLARQTNVDISAPSRLTQGRTASEIKGSFTPRAALDQLLAGTGLTARAVRANSFTIEAGEAPGELAAETSSGSNDMAMSADIIVTAQKREENLQDVPISISALRGSDLERESFSGISDVLKTVPGVATFGNRNGMGSEIVIRGVPTGSLFSGQSPVAYYLDTMPMAMVKSSIAPDAGVYDLDRVEVLRGPQGTLYGASAQAGVVRVLTKEASLDGFDFKARGLTSVTEHGGWNYQGDAAVNLPIVEDKLAVRVVAGYQNLGGWIDRPGDRNANDSKTTTLRFKVKAKPSEPLTLDGSVWISRGDFEGPSTGFANYTNPSNYPEPSIANYNIYSGRINYDFGFASLTSATSYMELELANTLDYNPFCCQAFQVSKVNSRIFVQDFLFSSSGSGPWRYSLGAFYRDGKDSVLQRLPSDPPGPNFSVVSPTAPRFGGIDKSRSYAFYGELTRALADGKFEITGGLRYFHDTVSGADINPGIAPVKESFKSVSPRIVLTWHPSDNAMVYATYSKGFRSGVVQSSAVSQQGFRGADPEDLFNYEVGTKGSLFDRLLDFDASVYFVKRKGIQQILNIPYVVPGGGTTFVGAYVNGPSASGLGVDFAFIFHPSEAVRLGVNGSVNDLEFDDDVLTSGLVLAPAGGRTNGSPRATFGAFGDVTFPIGNGGAEAVFAGSLNYRSKILANTTGGAFVSDSLLTGRTSLMIRPSKNWNVSVFIDNVTNENGVVGRDQYIPAWDLRLRPRTFGLQLDYKY